MNQSNLTSLFWILSLKIIRRSSSIYHYDFCRTLDISQWWYSDEPAGPGSFDPAPCEVLPSGDRQGMVFIIQRPLSVTCEMIKDRCSSYFIYVTLKYLTSIFFLHGASSFVNDPYNFCRLVILIICLKYLFENSHEIIRGSFKMLQYRIQ